VDPTTVMVERRGPNGLDGHEDGAVPRCGSDDGGGSQGGGGMVLMAEEERDNAVSGHSGEVRADSAAMKSGWVARFSGASKWRRSEAPTWRRSEVPVWRRMRRMWRRAHGGAAHGGRGGGASADGCVAGK
jgi:hypothetical protein